MSRKRIVAKYAGTCEGCGAPTRAGAEILWERGSVWHPGCAPTGHPRQDAEYMRGVREANEFRENRALFGEEAAERMEIEREMREGWDY